MAMLRDMASDLDACEDGRAVGRVRDKYQKQFKEELPTYTTSDVLLTHALCLSEADAEAAVQCILAQIRVGHVWLLDDYAEPLIERRKLIDWKKSPPVLDTIMAAFYNSLDTQDGFDKSFSHLFSGITAMLKATRQVKRQGAVLLGVVERALDTDSETHPIHTATVTCITTFPWKDDTAAVQRVLPRVCAAVRRLAEQEEGARHATTAKLTFVMICQAAMMNTTLAHTIAGDVAALFPPLIEAEWRTADNKKTLGYELLGDIMSNFYCRHVKVVKLMKPVMSYIKEMWECGDEGLERTANSIMTQAAGSHELVWDVSDTLIDRYFSGKDPQLINSFKELYPNCPEKFNARLDEFVSQMEILEDWQQMCTLSLFWDIAKKNPQIFTAEHIAAIAPKLDTQTAVHMVFQVLQCLAEYRPQNVIQYDDRVMAAMRRLGDMGFVGGGVLVAMSKCGEKYARRYLTFFCVYLETKMQSTYKVGIIYNMRSVGQQFGGLLADYRELFERLRDEPALADSCKACIDIIEGRSLEGIAQDVVGQRKDIDDLDDRVGDAEDGITFLNKEVDDTKRDVKNVKEDVTKVEGRLDVVEETVDETVEKVGEIDRKTLSHAPQWSRDVSQLMNPASDHDWRLLAGRLGYTNDDVRNWATQPDPCLSMFDEWFATHKTREATHAVLKMLEEMNRTDASMIVENALKAAEGVVEEEEEEYVEPPPIFLSYQWGMQQEVKLLKQHLERAGFKTWMDIGQMGGGDKLFEKIDTGIRAAKVVICCVTDKYAKSSNCNREVNLSVTLGKPVIPLLMEKMSWPPPGAMGPIFGEYLFVRFFARGGEESGDDRYWPLAKFQELIMQLRYNVIPQEDLIEQPYINWWLPPEEIITITPKQDKSPVAGTTSGTNNTQTAVISPDVFISYQWGKQPQIRALYRRLTELGVSCWLDILQMGGGDSLYDKIDKGVRGCKVVLTCVTSKYSLSANCRREVSLADALKKPIIPLLLESLTWPPEGSMSMVFTQLLYINFSKPDAEIQNHWQCPQFDELLHKIGGFGVPIAYIDEQTATQVLIRPEAAPLTEGKKHANKSEPKKSQDNTKQMQRDNKGGNRGSLSSLKKNQHNKENFPEHSPTVCNDRDIVQHADTESHSEQNAIVVPTSSCCVIQ